MVDAAPVLLGGSCTVAAVLLVLENACCSTWGCSVKGCGDLVRGMAVCVVITLGTDKGAHCALVSRSYRCIGQPVVLEIYETRGGIYRMEHFESEMAACHPSWERPFSRCLLNHH